PGVDGSGEPAERRRDRRSCSLGRPRADALATMPATRRPAPALAKVLERVSAAVRQHELILPGQTVVVAVSGGPDSVCLLEALVRLRRSLHADLVVAHVDHRVRPGSGEDASYVHRLA